MSGQGGTVHDDLAAEMAHDLRSYRAREREWAKRQPIRETMAKMREQLGLPPVELR